MSNSGGSSYKPVKNNPGIYQRPGKRARQFTYAVRDGGSRWMGTHNSLKEAQDFQNRMREMKRRSGKGRSSRVTVQEYYEDWPDNSDGSLAENTISTYRNAVSRFVRAFGTWKVRDLDPYECCVWARSAAPSWISPTRIMLNQMVRDQLLATNPLAGFKLGKQPGRKNRPPLSDEDVESLVNIAADTAVLHTVAYRERIAGIISIAAYSGIRVSETLALRHSDIDLESRSIRVERQITRKGKIVDLKTDFQRDIALIDRVARGLERFPPIQGSEYLYPKRDGTPFNRGSFYHHFGKVVAASGIPGLDFHELRHYFATWMMFHGVPTWAIDYQIGHESGAKVLRTLQEFGISVFSILGLEHDGDEVSKLYRHADAIAMIKIHEVLDKGTREFAPEVRRSDFVPPKKQVPPPTKRKV